ncbi:MAG TPA: ABC transporter permease [Victivallales bacterium]|nr:ABC transporter permease [Victivallales bacterium]
MVKYIIKRIIYAFITLWVIATITFFLMHMLPGNPFASEKVIPPQIKAQIMKKYGLDKPLYQQYGIYLNNLAHANLGLSMRQRGRKVSTIIANHFPYSLEIGIRAMIFGFVFGLVMGVIAALNRAKKWDTLALIIAIIGVSVPSFAIAGILQWLVIWILTSTGVQILPIAGVSQTWSTVLPTIALGMAVVAMVMRLMRASTIEVLGQDYIKTARAKGVSPTGIVIKHVLRNAIMPIITYIGPMLAAVLTGSLVVEKIFAIPGIGKYFVDSVMNNDYTTALGITLFYAVFLIAMVLIVDISYGFIDPRIRLHAKKGDN